MISTHSKTAVPPAVFVITKTVFGAFHKDPSVKPEGGYTLSAKRVVHQTANNRKTPRYGGAVNSSSLMLFDKYNF